MRFIMMLCCSVLWMVAPAQADTRWVEVEFPGMVTPTELIGILFSKTTSYQTADVRVSSNDNGRTVVAIPYESELALQEQVLAYAVSKDEAGTLTYTSVVPASAEYDLASGYAQSACMPKDVPSSMQSQMSLVANLLKIRGKRRENLREQISAKLSGEFLEKMQKYEIGFGLHQGANITPDMPASLLSDRLDRILHSLRKVPAKK